MLIHSWKEYFNTSLNLMFSKPLLAKRKLSRISASKASSNNFNNLSSDTPLLKELNLILSSYFFIFKI